MSANESISKYQFHLMAHPDNANPNVEIYSAYKDDQEVGSMTIHPDVAPGKAKVAGMRVAQGHRAVGPTLLGLAAVRADWRMEKLLPPSDLSRHSSKLIQGLQGRGLVTGSASTKVKNRLDFDSPSRVLPEYRMGRRLNTDTVNEGRAYARNLAKSRPKRR